ncbi:MAG: Peptidoglycan-binding lysin domain [Clostridia bacterium]|nr:Peptidoglycan-binding lysin domain [Clostridia bacterium]
MSFSKNFIVYNKLVYDNMGESSAESEIVLPDYYSNILRLIRTEAVPFIRSQSVYGDRLMAEGYVEFRIIYLGEDGTSLKSIFNQVPFSHSCEINGLSDNTENKTPDIRIRAGVEYSDIRALSPQKLHVKATIGLSIKVFKPSILPILATEKEGDVADDVFVELQEKNVAYGKTTCTGKKPLRISDDIDIGNKPTIEQILRYDVSFIKNDQKILNRKMIVKADMVIKVLYIPAGNNIPQTFEQRCPISQIIDLEGLDEDTTCNTGFEVSEFKLSAKENTSGEKKLLTYEAEINVSVIGYKLVESIAVTDAFSTKKEVECISKEVNIENFKTVNETVGFDETVEIGAYDTVYDFNISPYITNTAYDEKSKKVITSGNFFCTALFKDMSGDLCAIDKSVPFTVQTDPPAGCTSLRGELELAVISMAFVPADSTKLEFRLNCNYQGMLFYIENFNAITDIKYLNDKSFANRPEMILYYGDKGEKIWDIAKKYSSNKSAIIKNNNLSEDILEEKTMIYITK